MMLYLCRHAVAAEGDGKNADAERPLTSEGIAKFRKAATGFLETAPQVRQIYSSPALRARQTAGILQEVFARQKIDVRVTITEALGLSRPTLQAFMKELRALKKTPAIVAVGHEPTLSGWIAALCFGASVACRLEMKKGAIAAIELEDKKMTGTLVGLYGPKVLRALR